jgi:hypothetical protein
MSARSFRSVFMVASCAGAALGCYLVSLRVASERAALENVETQIVLAQRDIRLLQTEIGTRGRLAQLERWNVKVLALSAPSADQFLDGGFALAKLVAPQEKMDIDAPVVLASATADGPRPQVDGRQPQAEQAAESVPAREMLHVASLKRELRSDEKAITAQRPTPEKAAEKPATAAKPPAAKTPPAKLVKAPPVKAKPVVAQRKPVLSDPLAPIDPPAKPSKLASSASAKDSGSKQ